MKRTVKTFQFEAKPEVVSYYLFVASSMLSLAMDALRAIPDEDLRGVRVDLANETEELVELVVELSAAISDRATR